MADATVSTDGPDAAPARGAMPERVDRYHVLHPLGRGGLGAVHAASEPESGRRVAIVVLAVGGTIDGARALVRLVHPNLVAILDAGVVDAGVFVVMELVDGAPIDRWARATAASPVAIGAAVRGAARGLAAAHAAGIVHGDVSARRILVDRGGAVRVAGLGRRPPRAATEATEATDVRALAGVARDLLADRASARVRRALDRAATMTALADALAPPRARRVVVGATLAAAIAAIAIAIAALVATGDAPPEPAPAPPPVRADVSAQRELTRYALDTCASSPAVAADDAVVFDRTRGDTVELFAVPLAGGEPRQITAPSPTGQWRANRGRRDGDAVAIGGAIYYVDPTGIHRIADGVDRPFASAPPDVRLGFIAAARDGTRLAAVGTIGRSSTLCVVEVATARLACPVAGVEPARPAFGADSRSIYFDARGGIHRYDVDAGTDEVAIANLHAPGGIAVSGDGRALVASGCVPRSHVYDTSTTPRSLVMWDDQARDATTASDDMLAYWKHRDPDRVVLQFSNLNTVTLTPDTISARKPAVSRDTAHVAFVEDAPRHGIFVRGMRGAPIVQLTDDRADDDPVWLDARVVAFTRTGADGVPNAYVVPIDGGAATLVAAARRVEAARRGELAVIDATGVRSWLDPSTRRARAVDAPAGTAAISVSPSGQWIAFVLGGDRQEVLRRDLDDPGARVQHAADLAASEPTNRVLIDDRGRVLVTEVVRSGNLFVVPASAGMRF